LTAERSEDTLKGLAGRAPGAEVLEEHRATSKGTVAASASEGDIERIGIAEFEASELHNDGVCRTLADADERGTARL